MPGFGELFLLAIIIIAVFGARGLPRCADRLGAFLARKPERTETQMKDEL
ncbi:MAG: twin-arginine translocase TatA/TatE family subunit [Myxococcota bacterium]|jgi:Sec-independent protein translocase protein TatA|nr:twin-arginine translocase TatA/TatE family subunit [Myxococcota bacterium]